MAGHSTARARIADLIAARPGTNPSRLALELGVGRSTITHHLRGLERAGAVVAFTSPAGRLLFLNGRVPSWARDGTQRDLRAAGARKSIVALLRANEQGLTRGELAMTLPTLPERTRNDALRKLIVAGVVVEGVDSDPPRLRLA